MTFGTEKFIRQSARLHFVVVGIIVEIIIFVIVVIVSVIVVPVIVGGKAMSHCPTLLFKLRTISKRMSET